MTIEYRDTEVVFAEIVGVEDAEVLLAWLQERSPVQADFSACTHMHPANIQVLMAAGVQVAVWPVAAPLESALRSVFSAGS
ncbi:hypothetical protein MCEMSHM24_03479 [Comamonadaceae bacterium]|mgnify:FL=1|jgi:hypothetical protein|uniref:hypothetical protein n=1 Tax=Rhodoferax potami TaxID=3068338 RepID=UPI0028BE1655|nr:hypothetical protein [Rhodoferax sp. TBRC 17198]MDT7521175.1 hypothetical protein [Rhodoferax sp. TBRC 17198]